MMAYDTVGFTRINGGIPVLANHTWDASPAGELLHYVDGELRATVPPEGWESYQEQYQDAAPMIEALTTPKKAKK